MLSPAPAPVTAPADLSNEEPSERSREVRLGLVMYGGVSLAVYINGVAREFFRAVRGRGVYGLVKALTDSDVIVDVISGTSAGGINGIMLGYALCNEREFAATASLWRQNGGIQDLLRQPTDTNTHSVLDSENYYEPKLRAAFASMPPIGPPARLPFTESPSHFDELDLFVTGTNVDGDHYTRFDDAGHPIDVKEHRGVFLLKHRHDRKPVFEPADATHAALARLSRVTSCFPGAFAPVKVAAEGDAADALLRTWGRIDRDTWFLDGGVLDNKPFTLTLNAVFSRTADRDVDRKLFYVEPDPEIFENTTREQSPNVVQAVLSALIGIPSYESISEDLQRLTDHNTKVRRYNRITHNLETIGVAGSNGPAAALLYQQTRLTVISDRVIEGLFKENGRARPLSPEESEKAAELVRDFDAVLPDAHALFEEVDVYFPVRRIYRVIYFLFGLLNRPAPGSAPLSDSQRARYRDLWRVLNRQVRFYEVLRARMEDLIDTLYIPWKDRPAGDIWLDVLHVYGQLLATDAQHPFENDVATTFPEVPDAITPATWMPSKSLTAFNLALRNRATSLETAVLDAPSATPNLLQKAAAWDAAILDAYVPDPSDPVRHVWDTFAGIDEVAYPLETMSGVAEKDIIETVRISPRDAARGFSAGTLAEKVSGDSVYHFGGFFKRSWRANDILWGRLDGACQLLEALIDETRLRQIVDDDASRARVRQVLFEDAAPDDAPPGETGWWFAPVVGRDTLKRDYDPAMLFPRAGARSQRDLRRWLVELFSAAADRRAAALAETTYMTTLLIEMAQLETLSEELPHVIGDALDEQSEWNRYQVESGDGAVAPGEPPWTFRAPDKHIDPFVAVVGSARHSQAALDSVFVSDADAATPLETPLGRFFSTRYGVGSETLSRDVPSIVLLDVLASAVLVVKNCLLGAFPPEAAQRIRKHPLYKWTLDRPLRVLYGAVKITRRNPKIGAVGVGLFVVSAVVLLIGILRFDRLACRTGSQFNPMSICKSMGGGDVGLDVVPILLLVVLPAVILLALAYVALKALVIRRVYRRYKRWRARPAVVSTPPASTPPALRETIEALVTALAASDAQALAALERYGDPLDVAEARRHADALPAQLETRRLALRAALENARLVHPVLEAEGARARYSMPDGRPSLVFKHVRGKWYLMN